MIQDLLKEQLVLLSNTKHSSFSNKLLVNNEYRILGVKSPYLRQIADEISKKEGLLHIYDFLIYEDPLYYEEVIVTYFVFSKVAKKLEFNLLINVLDKILKYNNSWATNDTISMALKPSNNITKPYFYYLIEKAKSKNIWDIRFSVVSLMSSYLSDDYIDKSLEVFSSINSEEYYVNMALGWAFATALAKQNEKTRVYIFNKKINKAVNKIAIQKAIESRRICDSDKIKLKQLREELKSHS